MKNQQNNMLQEALLRLGKERHSLAANLEAHLPADHAFEDDSWNTWSWGKLAHRKGTATADFASIKHKELRTAIKLLVLYARATRKVGAGYSHPIICAAVRIGKILQARSLYTLTNADIQLCEKAIIKEFGASAAYLGELQKIVSFLSNWYEISLIYKRPKTAALRYGIKGSDEGRREKLISDSVLTQILSLRLRDDLNPEDKVFVNALALNTACGYRVSELLTLPSDCLCRDEGALFVRGIEAKGGLAAPRFVPSQLWPVVEQAIRELIEVTEPGREIARNWTNDAEPDWTRIVDDKAALTYFVRQFLHLWTADPEHHLINPHAAWHSGRAEWIDVLGSLKRNNGAVNKTTAELDLSWSTFKDLCNQQKMSQEGLFYQRTKARTKKNMMRDQRVMDQYSFFRKIGFASGQQRKTDTLQKLMEDALDAQMAGQSYPPPEQDTILEATYARQRPVLLTDINKRPVLYVDEALMVVPRFYFGKHQAKSDQFKVVEPVQFIKWLAGNGDRESIFERFGITDPKTNKIAKFTSHDIRHWLNTAYTRGGLTQVQIATLFNRQDVKGNSPYNHMTNEERREVVGGAIQNDVITGHITDTYRSIAEVDREHAEEYLQAMTRQLNVMPHGLCAKDLVTDPCPHHLSCFSCETDSTGKGKPCTFLVIDAADSHQLQEIKRIQENAKAMIEWFEEDEIIDTPQFVHFSNIVESTAAILAKRKPE
tara:strand:+ start:2147 stop:4288 length:2142 start_codon:yes stop_codon:yes gene_type:complete